MGSTTNWAVAIIAILVGFVYFTAPGDVLTGISSDLVLSGWQLQLAVSGFCLSNVPGKLLKEGYSKKTGGDFDFAADGDLENEDYNKGSIYSLLYALYANVGTVKSDLGLRNRRSTSGELHLDRCPLVLWALPRVKFVD